LFFFCFSNIHLHSEKRKKMKIKKRDDCPEKNEKPSGIIIVRSALLFITIYLSTFK
jgi:hypothetical protein